MDADAAIKLVNDTLASEFELDPARIEPGAKLREDLGLDSLDAVDMIVAMEKALGIQVPEEVARRMRTVGDIHAYIREVAAR